MVTPDVWSVAALAVALGSPAAIAATASIANKGPQTVVARPAALVVPCPAGYKKKNIGGKLFCEKTSCAKGTLVWNPSGISKCVYCEKGKLGGPGKVLGLGETTPSPSCFAYANCGPNTTLKVDYGTTVNMPNKVEDRCVDVSNSKTHWPVSCLFGTGPATGKYGFHSVAGPDYCDAEPKSVDAETIPL